MQTADDAMQALVPAGRCDELVPAGRCVTCSGTMCEAEKHASGDSRTVQRLNTGPNNLLQMVSVARQKPSEERVWLSLYKAWLAARR